MNRILLSLSLSTAVCAALLAQAVIDTPAVPAARVDAVFSRWNTQTPGCAVGVAQGGKSILEKSYGMDDLEHDVANTTETIFEAGSVSKQFTAAAVLLLAQEGKLSLDDPARKYLPELPDYGAPLTIRHMLQHTSGLRDWGEVESMAGWPRTTRTYSHAHVLDIVSRQKSLNFASGTEWSYSNTGYNLAAVIVSRVSGKPFAEFSEERIFKPLGMTRTSWRDDFTRIVKGRAIAYSQVGSEFRTNMPFENVHGNGGLLTTVGDLLKWNENFVTPRVGDAAFLKIEQEPGRFNDGKSHDYALGLYVRPYKGVPEVSHSGSTAGYRAHLTRYPQQHLSVAVLCNVSSGQATQYALSVADMYLGSTIKTDSAPAAPRARPETASFTPEPADIAAYLGAYYSDEAEVRYEVAKDGDAIVIRRRPDATIRLRATKKDEFASPAGAVVFLRDESGAVKEMSVRSARVFDMRFKRD